MSHIRRVAFVLSVFFVWRYSYGISLVRQRSITIQDTSIMLSLHGRKNAPVAIGTIGGDKIVLKHKNGNLAFYNMRGKMISCDKKNYGVSQVITAIDDSIIIAPNWKTDEVSVLNLKSKNIYKIGFSNEFHIWYFDIEDTIGLTSGTIYIFDSTSLPILSRQYLLSTIYLGSDTARWVGNPSFLGIRNFIYKVSI